MEDFINKTQNQKGLNGQNINNKGSFFRKITHVFLAQGHIIHKMQQQIYLKKTAHGNLGHQLRGQSQSPNTRRKMLKFLNLQKKSMEFTADTIYYKINIIDFS